MTLQQYELLKMQLEFLKEKLEEVSAVDTSDVVIALQDLLREMSSVVITGYR